MIVIKDILTLALVHRRIGYTSMHDPMQARPNFSPPETCTALSENKAAFERCIVLIKDVISIHASLEEVLNQLTCMSASDGVFAQNGKLVGYSDSCFAAG